MLPWLLVLQFFYCIISSLVWTTLLLFSWHIYREEFKLVGLVVVGVRMRRRVHFYDALHIAMHARLVVWWWWCANKINSTSWALFIVYNITKKLQHITQQSNKGEKPLSFNKQSGTVEGARLREREKSKSSCPSSHFILICLLRHLRTFCKKDMRGDDGDLICLSHNLLFYYFDDTFVLPQNYFAC